MKTAIRFPLPVDHSRAPFRCARTTAWLALAVAFGAGFTAALYSIGYIVTQP